MTTRHDAEGELRKEISKSMAVTFGKQLIASYAPAKVKELHVAGVDEIMSLVAEHVAEVKQMRETRVSESEMDQLNMLWDCFHPYDKEKTLVKWQEVLAAHNARLLDEVMGMIGQDEKDLPINDIYRTRAELRDYCRDRVIRDELRGIMRQQLTAMRGKYDVRYKRK